MAGRISEAWLVADDEIRIFCACAAVLSNNESSRKTHKKTKRKRSKAKKAVKFAVDPHCDRDIPETAYTNEGDSHDGRRDREHQCSVCSFCSESSCCSTMVSEFSSYPSYQSSPSSRSRRRGEYPSQYSLYENINICNNDDGGRGRDPSTSHHTSSVLPQQKSEHCSTNDISWDDLEDAIEEGIRSSLEELSSQVVEKQDRRLNRFSTINFDLSENSILL